jgi:hypothetical protein
VRQSCEPADGLLAASFVGAGIAEPRWVNAHHPLPVTIEEPARSRPIMRCSRFEKRPNGVCWGLCAQERRRAAACDCACACQRDGRECEDTARPHGTALG